MDDNSQSFVCILEDEFERLKNSQDFLFEIQNASKERLNLIRLQVEKELKYKIDKIEIKYIEYQNFINELNGEVRLLEIENQRRLTNQDKKLDLVKNEYIDVIKKSVEHYSFLLEKQNDKLTSLIKQEKDNLNFSINNIKENLEYLIDNEKNKKEKVNIFLADVSKIFEDTIKVSNSRYYNDKKEEELKRKLLDSFSDFKTGFYESSWKTAKELYWELTDIRNNIKEIEKKYFVLESSIYELVSELLDQTDLSKNLKITINKSMIDINYWSDGKLNIIRKDLIDIIKNVKENKYNISELTDILRRINYYKNNFNKLIQNAKDKVILSQLKYNYAKKITDIMENLLFYPKESFYQNDDYRKDYILKFENVNKNTVEITISEKNNSIFLTTIFNTTKEQNKNIEDLFFKNNIKR